MTVILNQMAWVIAPEANFDEVVDPKRKHPSRLTKVEGLEVLEKVIPIPQSVDPMWFAVDMLGIDPLALVFDLKDLDLKGLHRYGYVLHDPEEHVFKVYTTLNKKGVIEDLRLYSDLVFHLHSRDDTLNEVPKSLGVKGTSYYLQPSAEYWEDWWGNLGMEGLDKQTDTPGIASMARLRNVDWKATIACSAVNIENLASRTFATRISNHSIERTASELSKRALVDLCILPDILITQEGVRVFSQETCNLLRERNYAALTGHLESVRHYLYESFFKLPNHEMWVSTARCALDKQKVVDYV